MNICLFDIDGTLIDTGGAGTAAIFSTVLEQFGVDPLEGHVSVAGRSDRMIVRELFLLHGIEDSIANWNRFVTTYVQALRANLARRNGRVLPGVTELLERLRQRSDVALGLLTGNLEEGARLKLEYFGILHHFAFGGFGDHHLDRNDIARDALAAARTHLDGTASVENVWVLGDTPNDILCARVIGARAVSVATGTYSFDQLQAGKPDLLLDDLSDPGPVLALLQSQARRTDASFRNNQEVENRPVDRR